MAEGCGEQERQQCVQAQPALPGRARALRANRKTNGAARLRHCPSLRWQGGMIFIKQKLDGQRRAPPQNSTTGPRRRGKGDRQGGIGEQSQAPLVPLVGRADFH